MSAAPDVRTDSVVSRLPGSTVVVVVVVVRDRSLSSSCFLIYIDIVYRKCLLRFSRA